jgi:hypothetical protein
MKSRYKRPGLLCTGITRPKLTVTTSRTLGVCSCARVLGTVLLLPDHVKYSGVCRCA